MRHSGFFQWRAGLRAEKIWQWQSDFTAAIAYLRFRIVTVLISGMAMLRQILNRQAPPSREAIRQLIERSLRRDVKLRLALDGPDDVIKRFSKISLAGMLKELERNHSKS